jgi:hypothetical protein
VVAILWKWIGDPHNKVYEFEFTSPYHYMCCND